MSRKRAFVEELLELEISNLTDGWKYGKSHAFRNRCQGVLLSHKGKKIEELSEIFSVSKNTAYTWVKNWKKYGIIGLITKPGQGRKPTLSINNEKHIEVVETAVRNAAEKGVNMKDEIIEKLAMKDGFSNRTLRRFLQKKTTPTRDFVSSVKKHQMPNN